MMSIGKINLLVATYRSQLATYRVLLPAFLLMLSLFSFGADAAFLPDCDPVPGRQSSRPTCSIGHIIQLLVNIYNYLLTFAGLVLLLMLIWGGIKMITFYISETPEPTLQEAKHTITRALFGFILVAGAYLIVNTLFDFLGADKSFLERPQVK